MSMNVLVTLVALTGLCGVVWTMLTPQKRSIERAIALSIVISILVPIASPPNTVTAIALTSCILANVIALLRLSASFIPSRPPLALLAFLVASFVLGDFPGAGQDRLILSLVQLTLYISLWAALCALPEPTNVLLSVLPWLVVIQFLLSTSEQFFGQQAVWPRVDGVSQDIERRNNTLAPWLIGRSMGTASYSITLGIIAGIGTLAALMKYVQHGRKRKYLIVAALGVATIIFSGTRSAIVILVICCVVWMLMTGVGNRIIRTFFLGLIASILWITIRPLELLGLDSIQNTSSFEHRFGVLQTVPNLFGRDFSSVVFGTGYASISEILSSGIVLGVEGIQVFDQQFARTFAGAGIIGLTFLIFSCINGYRRADRFNRLVILFLTMSFFTYDSLSWRSLMVIFIISAGAPVRRMAHSSDISVKRPAANDSNYRTESR